MPRYPTPASVLPTVPAHRVRRQPTALLAPVGCALIVGVLALLPTSPAHAQGFGRFNRATPDESRAQSDAALGALNPFLNDIGYANLDRREATVAAIESRSAATARQAEVRRRIVDLVGGLPATTGPVTVRTFDSFAEDGFTIENIAYESLPGYWVTANVYVPAGSGPHPAMVIAPGHGAGKSSSFSWAAYFARAGVLVLSIDPMGQGERLQHYDPELGTSKVEPSGEHEHANQTTLTVGRHLARHWFMDGRRGVDYLTQRPDVDAQRIGTFGCSGGGTAAAYLAAMDDRIAVAAVSSFITSFRELLPGNGPQDAEQTLPGFLDAGLDFADWVELAAPRPYAIVAFAQDFFPFAGAEWTAGEARGFYDHFDAADRLRFIAGPGGHCSLGDVADEVTSFLLGHLLGPGAAVPPYRNRRPLDADALTVTPTGQVATSLGSLSVAEIARDDFANSLRPEPAPLAASARSEWLTSLQTRIRELTGARVHASGTTHATLVAAATADGYATFNFAMESEAGVSVFGLLARPATSGPHPVVVWLDALPLERIAADPDFQRLAESGHIVLALHLRGVLGEPDPNPTRLSLGQYMPVLLRALIVNRTLVGLRIDDTIRAINWVTAQPNIDATAVTLYGKGAQGMVALHVAALDERIATVAVEDSLVSYRAAFEAGLHRNLSELVVPQVLHHYDTPSLFAAIHPRPLTVINPANAMGQRIPANAARTAWEHALAPGKAASLPAVPDTLTMVNRRFGDPLPLP